MQCASRGILFGTWQSHASLRAGALYGTYDAFKNRVGVLCIYVCALVDRVTL